MKLRDIHQSLADLENKNDKFFGYNKEVYEEEEEDLEESEEDSDK